MGDFPAHIRTIVLPPLRKSLQKVYAPDPADAWNRIFFCLFTRRSNSTVRRLSRSQAFRSGRVRGLAISKGSFRRIEGGDRAIEPFYPSHFVGYGQTHSNGGLAHDFLNSSKPWKMLFVKRPTVRHLLMP